MYRSVILNKAFKNRYLHNTFLFTLKRSKIMVRIFAISLLIIPGIISAIGIKLMRDTLFNEFHPLFFHAGIQFTVGLIFFIVGIAFVAGFIVYRDRKKQLIKKKKRKNTANK